MSKHSLPADGAGLSSLNLSLDGRSIKATPSTVGAASGDINHKKTASVLATDRRSNSSYLDHNKATNKIPIPNRISSARGETSGSSSYRLGNKKSANLNRDILLKGKNEKDSNDVNELSKDSYVFKPLSQRSSTDESEDASYLLKQKLANAQIEEEDPLDIFFNSQPSTRPSDQTKSTRDKDEKLVRLKESTDSLRRQLQLDTASLSSESSPPRQQPARPSSSARHRQQQQQQQQQQHERKENREVSEKHNEAASKIQTWYRDNQQRRQDQKQDEIKRLLKEKNEEMVKKMERFNNQRSSSSSSGQAKPKTTTYGSTNRKTPTSIDRTQSTNKQSKESRVVSPPAAPVDEKPLTSARTESTNIAADRIEPLKMTTTTTVAGKSDELKTRPTTTSIFNNSAKNSTIESLLMDLEKIDRESELMLNQSSETKSTGDKTNKGNSLLEFLDEVAKKNTGMTPRAVKDYKNFESDAVQFLKTNQIVGLGTDLSPSRQQQQPPLSSRRTSFKEKSTTTTTPTTGIDSSAKSTHPAKETSLIKSSSTEKKLTNKNEPSGVSEELLSKAKSIQNELKSKISAQAHEIEERNSRINKLEKDLNAQRELTIRHAQEGDKEMQLRLEAQKNDYEAAIQRHLNFIDQLIDDKKVLSEKCEKLVNELKDAEKRYLDRTRTLEEKFKVETQRSKETLEAAEKLRREKWIEEKTRKIKEMTVKGLEPEIQALINKHKNEIKSMKAVHEAELMQADERAAQRYIKITEELRENYEREKEAAVQRERDVSKQRYEKSLQDEENSFLEQRRRLYAEIEEEKNRLAEQAANQRKDLDRQRKMLEENNLNAIETIRKEYATAQKEADKKYQTELQQLKEKLDIEKESWEQNFLKKQENWKIQKEREIRDQIKRERDKEIETLLTRLDSEATSTREEIERTAENRVKRIRDKYESELREVEKTERETMERHNTLKAKFNEMEGEYERLKTVVRQKEKDLEGIKKLTDTLQDERNRLADVLRQEFADRIVFAEEENKRLKLEIAELKSKHQYEQEKRREEIERMQRDNSEELNKVHEKIKQVVAKKDEAYGQLKQQHEAACKRADHLEGLLEQQRALMLRKANETSAPK